MGFALPFFLLTKVLKAAAAEAWASAILLLKEGTWGQWKHDEKRGYGFVNLIMLCKSAQQKRTYIYKEWMQPPGLCVWMWIGLFAPKGMRLSLLKKKCSQSFENYTLFRVAVMARQKKKKATTLHIMKAKVTFFLCLPLFIFSFFFLSNLDFWSTVVFDEEKIHRLCGELR